MNKPISLEDLKRYRALVETGTPLDKGTVLGIIAHAGEAAETIQRKQSAIDTLDRIITTQCDAALNATGLHHLIDEDGDGDWGAVWEALADFKDWKEQAQQSERDRVNLKNRLDAMRRQCDGYMNDARRKQKALDRVSTLFEGVTGFDHGNGVTEDLNATIKATINRVLDGEHVA